MCLHKGLLKRSLLCKLGTSNVTNISPRRCTNALRRSGNSRGGHLRQPADSAEATIGPRHQVSLSSRQLPVSRRLFLFSPLPPPAGSFRTPPHPPALPRAGYGCSVRRRPSPAPGPGAPLRPASSAGSHPLHPGTDSSRPDFGTMVMAEGTAVLRRNRPGTKAQVSSLNLSCGGTLGAEPCRTCKLAAPGGRLGRGGRKAGGGTSARPALPEPQPLSLAEAAAAREACGTPT